MLTFPSRRLVDCGLYRCHDCKLSDISACCIFCQISTTEKEKTVSCWEKKVRFHPNQPLKYEFFHLLYFNCHRIKESLKLENMSKDIQSNHWPIPPGFLIILPQMSVELHGGVMTQVQPLNLCLVESHTSDLSPQILQIPLFTSPRLKPTAIWWPATIQPELLCVHKQVHLERSQILPWLAHSIFQADQQRHPMTLVSSAKWWKVHLIPWPRLLIKILGRNGLNTEPWRISLVTGHQLAATLFTCVLKDEPLERPLA